MLNEDQVKEKIKKCCIESDVWGLDDALFLDARARALCEVLGADPEIVDLGLSKGLLQSVGIKVLSVNPTWVFE